MSFKRNEKNKEEKIIPEIKPPVLFINKIQKYKQKKLGKSNKSFYYYGPELIPGFCSK